MSVPIVPARTTTDIHGFFTEIFPAPVLAQRIPAGADTAYEIGQIWIAQNLNSVYILTNFNGPLAVWTIIS